MSEKNLDLCVHGNPIDSPCDGMCEHGVRCGGDCADCDGEYWRAIDRMCCAAGDGDPKRGARALAKVLIRKGSAER